jgi:hypothetical protein
VSAQPVLLKARAGVAHHAHRDRRHAVVSLARVEAVKLLRSPVVLAGSALSVAAFTFASRYYGAPAYQRIDILTGAALLPLAAASLLATNLAALRSRRDGTDELFEGTVVPISVRTLAHAASVAAPVALGAAMVVAFLLAALPFGPVGAPRLAELLSGPAAVAAAGCLGVALARWWPSPLLGPIAVVALAVVQVTTNVQGVVNGDAQRVRWLLPWASLSLDGNPAPELVLRPSGWHVVYLLAAAATTTALAVLRHRATRRRVVAFAVALAVAVGAGAVELQPPGRARLLEIADWAMRPDAHQVCEVRDGVRYCVYPSYRSWVDRWAATGSAVVRLVPPDELPPDVMVQQVATFDGNGTSLALVGFALANGAPPGRGIRVGIRWPGDESEDRARMALALGLSGEVVGLPAAWPPRTFSLNDVRRMMAARRIDNPTSDRPLPSCDVLGQARAAVALWLAAIAEPSFEGELRAALPGPDRPLRDETGKIDPAATAEESTFLPIGGGGVFYTMLGFGLQWTRPEGDAAAGLLVLPEARVQGVLSEHWTELVDPHTKTTRLLALAGLPPVASARQRIGALGLTPGEATAALRRLRSTARVAPCR